MGRAMARLAFMTFGVLYEPRSHERSSGFINRIPATYDQAERSEGFIGRSDLDAATGKHTWGELVCPSFLSPEFDPHIARTLSLWSDLESVMAFSYSMRHGEALRMRNDWFRKPDFPGHVAWWVADDHIPTFIESTARLEQLHEAGPSAQAFNFKNPFDANGNPTRVDQALVQAKMARNAARISA